MLTKFSEHFTHTLSFLIVVTFYRLTILHWKVSKKAHSFERLVLILPSDVSCL